ncbi:MAG: hypothetical protein OIF32_10720 [Campylobacterales bacterium]|nr:hypothetical protein [Campylobacterales bacterium]
MKKLFILCIFSLSLWGKLSPSEVFTEVEKIEKEILIIKKALNINTKVSKPKRINTNLKPRHVWQKSYLLLMKVNVLRRKHQLPRIEEPGIEPVLDLNPDLVYEQTQRILTELRIFKTRKNIKKTITPTTKARNKNPIDVFNKMHQVSMEIDSLIGQQTAPSDVYSQVMRIYEDIGLILSNYGITDDTIPPAKNRDSKPKNAFLATMSLLEVIAQIQKKMGIEKTNFDPFIKDNIQPKDVINIVNMAIAELQPIKAYMEMKYAVTPPSKYYTRKIPADVEQLVKWNIDRLRLIKEINNY